jgi:hypothetical protein
VTSIPHDILVCGIDPQHTCDGCRQAWARAGHASYAPYLRPTPAEIEAAYVQAAMARRTAIVLALAAAGRCTEGEYLDLHGLTEGMR